MIRILIVEDERPIANLIDWNLTSYGYSCQKAYDGLTAADLITEHTYDLVLLDIMLPGIDGYSLLEQIKPTGTPVIFLTAKGSVADRVQGLRAGADDYLVKPFHLEELEARVRSLTRRRFVQQDVCLRCGGLTFDTRSRAAAANGQALSLTRKESGILEYLLLNRGRPVSQEELIEHVWDSSVDSFSNSIRVHISTLRKKLRAALGYDPIRNKIGQGYEIGAGE